MNFKRRLLLIIASILFIIPFKSLAYTKYVIPSGKSVGISIKTDGVYVVGFYKVDGENIAYNNGIRLGDKIISINGEKINDIASLSENINVTDNNIVVSLGILRQNKYQMIKLNLRKDQNGIYKTGMYVKDTITGIGTITFVTVDGMYSALGHEVLESSTNTRFEVSNGLIYDSNVTSITKSKKGYTGEKNAQIFYTKIAGTINKNLETGIFGKYHEKINDKDKVMVASMDEVQIGKAEIITVLENNIKKTYMVEILSIDKSSTTKNFKIALTDEELINKTGGIIKGMSGSPIIQNGKIIGAITHALVDKPTIGYGISIIKMLESME